MKRRRFLALSAAFACAPRFAVAASWSGLALGAEVSVTLYGPRTDTAPALAAIPALLEETEALFSLYRPSALTRLNVAGRLEDPPRAMRDLIAAAEHAHALTGGLFDPTVQPLWRALAEGRDPGPARALIGWSRLRVGPRAIALAPGQALTFNGIAQGWATDRVRDALAARGFTRALVDIGEQAAIGGPFRLGLIDPVHGILGQRTLTDTAIATSSPGALYLGKTPHILSPDGRAPLWSTLSVEAETATLADALSTAAVYLPEDALANLARAPGVIRITAVSEDGSLRSFTSF